MPTLTSRPIPPPADLEYLLRAELTRLGKDPDKAAAAAPSGAANAAFDLAGSVVDPDGPPDGQGGGLSPSTGVELRWTERLQGDYNQDGLVNTGDLAPLGINWMRQLAYDSAQQHGGLEYWPSGDPDDSGGADYPDPPAVDSGAANWRLARVDGNGDTQLSVPDISTIAQHWMEQSDGYRVYRRNPNAVEFVLLPNPDDIASYVSVPRSSTFPAGQHLPDPTRPVRFSFMDAQACPGGLGPGVYQYKVACYDILTGKEGPLSLPISVTVPAAGETNAPWLTLSATPLEGSSPLQVQFNAEGSYDPDGGGLTYEWDWTSDGTYEYFSGSDPHGYYTYSSPGTYLGALKATDDEGQSTLIHATVLVNDGYWVHTWGGTESNSATAIALDSHSNVYIAASVNSVQDGSGLGVLSYSTDGNLRWVKSFGTLSTENNGTVVPACMAVTPDDQILIGAAETYVKMEGSQGINCSDLYLIALDTAGRIIWQRSFKYINYQFPRSIVVDSKGDIVLCYDVYADIGSDNFSLIQRYSRSGDLLSQKMLQIPDYTAYLSDVLCKLNPINGQLYFSTYTRNPLLVGDGSSEPILIATDSEFNVLWGKVLSFAGFYNGKNKSDSMVIDKAGNCIVCGSGEYVPIDANDKTLRVFSASIDALGSVRWGFTWQPDWMNLSCKTAQTSVAIDSYGNPITSCLAYSINDRKFHPSVVSLDGAGNVRTCVDWDIDGNKASLTGFTADQTGKLFICGQGLNAGGGWEPAQCSIINGCWGTDYPFEFVDNTHCVFLDSQLAATTPVGVADIGGGLDDVLAIANPPLAATVPIQAPEILGVAPHSAVLGHSCGFRITSSGGLADAWSWDFGPQADPRYSPSPTPGVVFTATGIQQCSLTMTNSVGSDSFDFTIQVDNAQDVPCWRDQSVVAIGTKTSGWAYCAAAVINGKPQIAYAAADSRNETGDPGMLYHVAAADAFGLQWNASHLLEQYGEDAAHVSVLEANGVPLISYLDHVWTALDSDGSAWFAPSTVGNNNSALATINGAPALCYLADTGDAFFTTRTAIGGSSWEAPNSMGLSGSSNTYRPGLLELNGLPAAFIPIIDFEAHVSNLWFVLSQDPAGDHWNAPVQICSDNLISYYIDHFESSAVLDGVPAVCLSALKPEDGTELPMRVLRANDPAGTSWNDPVPICANAVCLAFKVINGRPLVVYRTDSLQLWSQQATNSQGTIWGESSAALESGMDVCLQAALFDCNGIPAIVYTTSSQNVYVDPNEYNVKFARFY